MPCLLPCTEPPALRFARLAGMILLLPILICADLLATLIAVLLINWWAPLFAATQTYRDAGVAHVGAKLPWWLTWFDTFDADLDTGARGGMVTATSIYWARVQWLYRNPAYGWSYWVLGCAFDPAAWSIVCNRGNEHEPGFIFFARSTDGRFNLHCIRAGVRFKIGWKAWNMVDAGSGAWRTEPWGPEWRIPFVFSISRI